ncbi:MAG TPA: copper chaperone PCu(A)C [Rhodanobacteraceae bacterium]|nr:copper chaperone PCu(A)C [Rhodanobacteraceae bacterium]
MNRLGILFAAGAALAMAGNASATPAAAGSAAAPLAVSNAWIRLLPGDLPAGGYATLRNTGDQALRLTSAHSNAFRMVMLHQSTHGKGMESMHMVSGIDIPAHGEVTLAPGGYHLMLMHRSRSLKPGDTVTITLKLADGRQQDAAFAVRPANAH